MDSIPDINQRIRQTIKAAPQAEQNTMLWRQLDAQQEALENLDSALQSSKDALQSSNQALRLSKKAQMFLIAAIVFSTAIHGFHLLAPTGLFRLEQFKISHEWSSASGEPKYYIYQRDFVFWRYVDSFELTLGYSL